MNSRQADCILAVKRTSNFTKAAEILHMTQPTLTYHIHAAEQEVGFPIFIRSTRGALVTSGGEQLIRAIEESVMLIQHAIELGRNVITTYTDTLKIGIAGRSILYFLPEAIRTFSGTNPDVDVVTGLLDWEDPTRFLQGEFDLYCGLSDNMKHIPDIARVPLFASHVYLVVNPDDPLATKDRVGFADLAGRTLMVGGKAPMALQELQRKAISTVPLKTYNSYDTLTPMIDIKAGKGIALVLGSMNDHTNEFRWIPFEQDILFPYDLCWHKRDTRKTLTDFISLLCRIYRKNESLPL